jgi:hypothetical protein
VKVDARFERWRKVVSGCIGGYLCVIRKVSKSSRLVIASSRDGVIGGA